MAEADPMKFMLELVDRISDPAKAASKQLQVLEKTLQREEVQLERLKKQMAFMQQQDKVSITSYRNLSSRIQDKTAKVADLRNEMGGLSQVAESGDHGLMGLGETLGRLAPIVAGAAVAFEGLKLGLDLLAEGEKMAIEAAEAKNETVEMLDALLGGQEAALSTYRAVEGLQSQVALSHTRLLDLTRQLTAAGITNRASLLDAVKGIGQVESILGTEGGSKLQSIIERTAQTGKFKLDPRKLVGTGIQVSALNEELARRMGRGVKTVEAQLKAGRISAEVGIAALTAVVDRKFGELARGKTLTFTAQIQRARDNIMKLFEDVDTSKLLKSLDSMLSVFDQSTVSGQALHSIITKVFDSVSDALAAVAPYVKVFFKGMVIAGLEAYIGLKPLLYDLGILGKDTSGVSKFSTAMSALGVVIRQTAFEVSVLFRAGIMLYRMVDFLSDLPKRFMQLGMNIVTGFADGITAGISHAVGAVSNMGASTVAAFKRIWKISSPSAVARDDIARNIVLGYVQGIDRNLAPANDAMSRLGATTAQAGTGAAVSSARGAAAPAASGITIVFQPGAIVINGVANAEQMAVTLPNAIADVLEQRLLARAG